MATKIQLRRDLASSWININPILAQGEPGLEIDTNRIKYGNGNTPWNMLPYSVSGSGENTQGQFIALLAGTNSEYPVLNSISIDGVNWTPPQPVSYWQGVGQADAFDEFFAYDLAVGNGKVVYAINWDNSENPYFGWCGLAVAESGLDSPQQLLSQDCTYSTPDAHRYPIVWNSIKFTGGYFVALGGYFNTNNETYYPCFSYSSDGNNWAWGNIDNAGLIQNLITTEHISDNLEIGMTLNNASYNGQGWLFSLAWY